MKFTTITSVFLSLIGITTADFYFGSISGEEQGCAPFSCESSYCNYLVVYSGQDICDASNFTPGGNSGACPGQDQDAPDFCGSQVGGSCPSTFVLDSSDDCGAAMNANGNEVPSAGTFYANVLDTSQNNATVGRCVYELSGQTTCVEGLGTGVAETFIHCYTTMYGTTAC